MIFINGKFLLQRRTGVQRYAFELTNLLLKSELEVKILVPVIADLTALDFPEDAFIKTGFFKRLTLWEQIDLTAYVARKKGSLLISFCNTGPFLLRNHIICIHDMSYHFNPKWFSNSFSRYYKFLIPRLAKKALHVITVSEFSKREICENLNVPTTKVSVINNAPSEKFVVRNMDSLNFQKDNFFLFVGSHDPRKNIQLLIKVFSLKEYSSLKLVVIGAAAGSFQNENYKPAGNIKFITNCDDLLLADYYQRARALINGSFYEGFGLPVVEAMASGCPLIISNIPAFVEIAQRKAIYFDPHSLSTLKIALNNFLKKTDSEVKLLITKNYQFSFNYDWKTSGSQLVYLINKLSNGRY
jgi:glycosyltransferase involved in cell wall biosynthesis